MRIPRRARADGPAAADAHEPDAQDTAPDQSFSGSVMHDGLARPEQPREPLSHRWSDAEHRLEPAWRRFTRGESRVPVTMAVITAVILQVVLPNRLTLGQRFVLPSLETMLVIGLVAVNPRRIQRRSRPLRLASMGLIALISLANAWAAGQLIRGLIQGTEGSDAGPLLATGAAIWATNIIVFALWYWELDRGGPSARAAGERQHADFLFPQMANPELGPPDWEPQFVDYLYLSFTNATAFSPTDVMPLTRWTKMLMLVQSAVSLVTIALVIARAVNILK